METKVKYDDYASLLQAAKDAGVKETRLDKAVDSHSLPESGQFSEEITIVDGEMAHMRMNCVSGHICSIGRIRPTAAFVQVDSLEKLETVLGSKEETKGNVFLKTSLLNSQLPADQARCAMLLAGKYFRTKVQKGYVTPLKMGADKKPIFAKNTPTGILALKNSAVLKDFWSIEISDIPFTN